MEDGRHVAIVTGAARPWGLGRCTAMGLADKGLDIAIVDVQDEWGEQAAKAVREEKRAPRDLYQDRFAQARRHRINGCPSHS